MNQIILVVLLVLLEAHPCVHSELGKKKISSLYLVNKLVIKMRSTSVVGVVIVALFGVVQATPGILDLFNFDIGPPPVRTVYGK